MTDSPEVNHGRSKTMKKVAITFGPAHSEFHEHIAPRIHEGYVVIEAPDREVARRMAEAIFGREWAFDYDMGDGTWMEENLRLGYHPAGELLRIAWLGINAQSAIISAVDATFEAAEGSSNDEEIEALQDARDLLAAIINYTPEEEKQEHSAPERTREPFTGQSGEW
jgi:hypothetical protein